jgi:sulfur dioxygenase
MALIFRQFFELESSTYTYLLADSSSREAIIIDPVKETLQRDLQFISEMQLKLKYILETHVHADHITSAGPMRKATGAQIAMGKTTGVETADLLLDEKETIQFGQQSLQVLLTPGHTNGCTSFVMSDRVFSGDTLLIRGCGRTDFQGGSSETLFQSVREKILTLPDETLVYPGHDYKGRTCSSIAEEKQHNPRLKMSNSLNDFVEIMENLNLAQPKKIDIAVPANLKSGLSTH